MTKNDNQNEDILPDEELMRLASEGQTHSFSIIIRRHQQALVNFFRKHGVYSDAEDLTQETFIKLFRFRDKYEPRAKFTTFLYLMARRIYVDYLRRQERDRARVSAIADDVAIVESTGHASSDREARAVEMLQVLSEEMRSVVIMNIYQGLRYHEIAEALEISVGTVKTRMFYALRKLREAMNHDDETN